MSKQHHDGLYYDFLAQTKRRCINPRCVRKRQQFHHMPLVGSRKTNDVLPRRHSTYNVVWICAICHREVDSGQGEARWLQQNFGEGILDIYREVIPVLGTYRGLLTRRLHDVGVVVPTFEPVRNSEWPRLMENRELMRQYHDDLTWLSELCKAHGIERTGQA